MYGMLKMMQLVRSLQKIPILCHGDLYKFCSCKTVCNYQQFWKPSAVVLSSMTNSSRNFTIYTQDVAENPSQCDSMNAEDDASSTHHNNSSSSKTQEDKPQHVPVMLDEVLKYFEKKDGQVILDMTFGAGGHTKAILENLPGSKVIALDRDPEAFGLANKLSEEWHGRVIPVEGCFSDLSRLLKEKNVRLGELDGAVFDLGCSSMQFDQSVRGFSLSNNGPLDMRMDAGRVPGQPTAADIVNHLDESDLFSIIKKYGEEPHARKIAHAIVESRAGMGSITMTHQLADIVSSIFTSSHRRDKLNRRSHVATKTFQALRIFVNNELNELNTGLHLVNRSLRQGGVCVVISFHSLEDRIVKRHFHDIDLDNPKDITLHDRRQTHSYAGVETVQELSNIIARDWEPFNRKVVLPNRKEIEHNPRSRSAKLRVATKVRN